MNRKQEYQDLLAELNNTPPALEYAVTRAEARARRSGGIRKFLIIPTGSLITFFIVFVAMVNLSMPFAMACGQIPLLRELAAAVAFSPSLSAAIENKYVQIVGLEQTENGITMRIEYVIVDQKQLNIFYTLHSKDYFHLHAAPSIRSSDGSELDWGSISNSDGENKGICQFVIDFREEDMPDSLILNCIAYDSVSYENSNTNFVFNLTLTLITHSRAKQLP